jgi:putative tryptophan/tyrosine transport system substrate-binding protein
MRRRKFITLAGGAAIAWPLAARAQQPGMPVVGLLRNTPSASFEHIVVALSRGLGEAGFVDGRNVVIEQRWAEGRDDRLPALLADLIGRKAAVIVANTQPPRLRRPPHQSCSRQAAIRCATASSPASTGRAPTSPA